MAFVYPGSGLNDTSFTVGSTSFAYQPHNFFYGSVVTLPDCIVTELGGYVDTNNTGAIDLRMGLYNASGVLLVQGQITVPNGNSQTWRAVNVTDTVVVAGTYYVVGVASTTELRWGYNNTGNGSSNAMPYAGAMDATITIPTSSEPSTLIGVRATVEKALTVATYTNGGQQTTSGPSISSVIGSAGTFLWAAVLWQAGGNCTDISYGPAPLLLGTQTTFAPISIREGYLASPSGTATVTATLDVTADNVWVVVKVISAVTGLVRATTVYANGTAVATLTASIALPTEGIILSAAYHRDVIQAELTAGSGGVQDVALEEAIWGSTVWSGTDIVSNDVQMNWATSSSGVHMVAAAFQAASGPSLPIDWNWRRRENRPAPFRPGMIR